MNLRRSTTAAALVIGLAITACSGADNTSDAAEAEGDDPPAGADVTIAESRFGPTEIVVGIGEAVTFVNTDPFAHTVTATGDSTVAFDSGELDESGGFEVSFDEAGEYAYFCQIHPTMRATVIVE